MALHQGPPLLHGRPFCLVFTNIWQESAAKISNVPETQRNVNPALHKQLNDIWSEAHSKFKRPQ